MLALTRKQQESIVIYDATGQNRIVVKVSRIDGDRVRIGIDAPKSFRIVRDELDESNAR